jgi:predicted protein tyrosine phosphatase
MFGNQILVRQRGSKEVMPKALFVCSANLQRSPTAEDLFQDWKGVWQTKSAGIMPALGRNSLTQELVDWADVIVAMEQHHAEYIQTNFRLTPAKIRVLNIPDRYARNDPALVQELRRKVSGILKIP